MSDEISYDSGKKLKETRKKYRFSDTRGPSLAEECIEKKNDTHDR